MRQRTAISPDEVADRLSIRELIDTYARHIDRRDPVEHAALFTEDARVVIYIGDPATTEPVHDARGRGRLGSVFDLLSGFDATTHLNGQSIIEIDGERATAETYCLSHHFHQVRGVRTLMVAGVRYQDVLAKVDGLWLFTERRIVNDWLDSRPSTP